LLALALVAGACEGETKTETRATAADLPDQILSDFRVEMTRGDLKTAVIVADKGVIYRKRDSMIVEQLAADFFDDEGLLSSKLWSDSGLIRERKREMIAHGHVRLENRDSLKLTADSLFWYGGFFDPSAEGGRVRANKKPEQRYMVAKQNVHLVTRDTVQLWTDTLLWNDQARTVATDAYVRIVRRGEDTLRGEGLRSDDALRRITILRQVSGRIQEAPK